MAVNSVGGSVQQPPPAGAGSGTVTQIIAGTGLTGGTITTTGTIALSSPVSPSNGGVANIATANQGYFTGGNLPLIGMTSSVAVIVAAANNVRGMMFVLPFQCKITKLTWETVASAGDTVSFGIYSIDGATKLVDSGATVSVGSAAAQTVTIAEVTLPPGPYWFAWTQTGTPSTTFLNYGGAFNIPANAQTVKKFVLAGNAATAGALPSALGTLTTAQTPAVPVVIFEP